MPPKLPEWRSSKREEQEALTRFIIAELDRDDEQIAHDAANDEEGIRHLGVLVKLAALAREAGMPMPWPKEKSRPGPKARDMSDFDRAAADVPRIRALFLKHWGKRNRTVRPMAEEIAAERWELSAEQTATLINRFRRKP